MPGLITPQEENEKEAEHADTVAKPSRMRVIWIIFIIIIMALLLGLIFVEIGRRVYRSIDESSENDNTASPDGVNPSDVVSDSTVLDEELQEIFEQLKPTEPVHSENYYPTQ